MILDSKPIPAKRWRISCPISALDQHVMVKPGLRAIHLVVQSVLQRLAIMIIRWQEQLVTSALLAGDLQLL